jgi:YVTN family beta-propeller protein
VPVQCPSCGASADAEARFCSRCGRTLAAAIAVERRVVVTILFCDLVESTKLGERVDPELLREIQAQYFAVCSLALHRHGGHIEKFIGDAVLCVFGVPRVNEDDALRACRAALDLLAGIGELNERLAAEWSVRLDVRIGINTGEVVAGALGRDQILATGDAVNVAARLEQAAGRGEILVGAETHRLVAGRVDVEAVPPLPAKGKTEPLRAYRLRGIREAAPGRAAAGPFIGRDAELTALADDLAAVTASRSPRAVLVVGEPGVGKSRLIAELARSTPDEVTFIRGTCLPYGEGITFWPVREMLDRVEERGTVLADLLGADSGQVDRLLRAVGRRTGTVSRDETFDATVRLFEALAAAAPVLAVFEDLQWAEPLLLELVDALPASLPEARLLVLGTARPELLVRGAPATMRPLRLEPLRAEDAAAIAADHGLDEEQRRLVVRAAGGNPLFLEQLCAAGVADGTPPDIRALLDARLDTLERDAREVVEVAAVVGRDFWIEALRALVPERAAADLFLSLRTLEQLELVHEAGGRRGGPPTGLSNVFPSLGRWSFRHALVQEAAYRSLTKTRRSALHARFASYLEKTAGDVAGLDAVIGWHLEQAARLRAELRPADAAVIAARAAARLEDAGRQALDRDDPRAASKLLGRAAALVGDDGASSGAEPLLERGHRIADFVVDSVAGRGGMGVVYKAHDERLGRVVALKVISPGFARDAAFRARFERESLIAAQIEHPNVVPVYTAGESEGRLFIAMRFVAGTDLASLIEREGRLDRETAAAIVDQVAHALDAAHARGLVHRDVKPGNVLLTREGSAWRAFLTDFGLSVQGGGEGALTRTGQWVGTLAYVAPEQVRGRAVDGRTDVYALGGVLHHCLTGEVPYPRAHELDALSAHLAEPPPRPSSIVPELIEFDGVVARAMQKDPGRRYAAAGELAAAALAAAATEPRRFFARRAVRRLRDRRAGPAVAAVLAVAAIAGIAVALISRGGGSQPPTARSPTRISIPQEPDRLTILGTQVWAVSSDGGRLARVDPKTRRVGSFPSPVDLGGGAYPDIASGFGSIWLAHANPTVGGIDRIDPASVQAIQHIPLPGASAVAVGPHDVWAVGHRHPGETTFVLAMIDPRRNRIVRSLAVGPQPAAVAEGAGAVWIADARADSVYRVDPADRRVVAKIPVGAGPARVVAGSGVVWVANLDDETLSRIDPSTNRVVGAPLSLGKQIEDVALAGGTLWVASADATVVGLRASDGSVVTPPVSTGTPPLALASAGKTVWVASVGDSTIQRIAPS